MNAKPAFKMLHSYQKEDADIFFGRDEEIKKLISFTYTTDLILVYGETGTGKTSLVQCGLTKGFNDNDRVEIYIRKGDNINISMMDELGRIAETPIDLSNGLNDAVHSLYLDFLKPVYLIFDQFEELFISGTPQEREKFYPSIKELLASGAPARVILIMREEYLALLNDFEEEVPSLFDYRLRVETMKKHTLIEVIEKSLDRFGIEVEGGQKTIMDIIRNNQDEHHEVQLPYLQVYLDRLYRTAEKSVKPVIFTPKLVKETGKINDVLSIFLDEQTLKIQSEFLEQFPEQSDTFLKRVLNEFVSDEGKRKQVSTDQLIHLLPAKSQKKRKGLIFVLNRLVESRILNTLGKYDNHEIAHDELARCIDHKRTTREKRILLAERIIKDKQKDFEQVKSWLNEQEINIVPIDSLEFKKDLKHRLEEKHIDFLKKSEVRIKDQKRKLDAQKRRRNRYIILSAIVLIGILVVGLIITRNRAKTDKANYLAMQALFETREDPTIALNLARQAWKLNENPLVSGTLHDLYSKHRFYKILVQSDNEILAFDVSGDGKRFITGHTDGNAQIWNQWGKTVMTLEKKFNQKGHTSTVSAVAFSPDGNTAITGSYDRTAIIWNISGDSPLPQRLLKKHKGSIECVNISPDGEYILTGSEDTTAILWNKQGNVQSTLKGHTASISSIEFSPDGKSILTASFDNTARIWDLAGNEIHRLEGHNNAVYTAVFSQDGNAVLTGSADQTARIWMIGTNTHTELKGHQQSISSVSFSPDGKRIITGSMDKTLRIWDWQGNLLQILSGHKGEILALRFSPSDPNFLFSGSYDGTIRLWDLRGSPLQIYRGHNQTVSSVAFMNRGTRVLTGSLDNTARVWSRRGTHYQEFKSDLGEIYAVAVSPDNSFILTASHKFAWIWNLRNDNKKQFSGHGNWVYAAAFSPLGNTILTGSYDKTARLWSINDNSFIEFKGHTKKITSVAFSSGGGLIITGSQDTTARLWNLRGELINIFSGHKKGVTSVAFAPDGKTVLTGSQDKTARLWNLKGKKLLLLDEHKAPVSSVAFSPRGEFILTGSYDKTARVWNLEGDLIQVFKGHTGEITCAVFSPDGEKVLTGSMDNTARLWQFYPLQDFLRNNNFQPLSDAQKKKFGIED